MISRQEMTEALIRIRDHLGSKPLSEQALANYYHSLNFMHSDTLRKCVTRIIETCTISKVPTIAEFRDIAKSFQRPEESKLSGCGILDCHEGLITMHEIVKIESTDGAKYERLTGYTASFICPNSDCEAGTIRRNGKSGMAIAMKSSDWVTDSAAIFKFKWVDGLGWVRRI